MSLLLWCSLLLCRVARADGVTHVAFSETFDVNQSTGGRDGVYSGSGVASGDIAYIQEGWIGSKSSSYVYGGSACLRFGNSSNDGSCTTPEFVLIGAAKTATLTYSAAGWGNGTNKLTISANDGVTLSGDTQVTLANGQWKTYSVTLTLTTATSVQLTFSGRRGFLDDVTVTETVTSIVAPTLTDACTFWPNTTEEAVMTVTVVPADSTTVYYTTDGTEPTPSNGHVAMLTSNFSIEGTTTVKARAYFKTLASNMVSRTYTQGATVGSIAAFKALADGTETRLAISADANARVLHGYNNKVYLRDNSGAICFDFGTTAVFNPAPVHNQHVAGWIVGRKQTENGLPKLVATGNTTTDYLAMAAPVTEAATEPAATISDKVTIDGQQVDGVYPDVKCGLAGTCDHELLVPKYFYMALLHYNKATDTYHAVAFWTEHLNVSDKNKNFGDYAISIDELQRRTGIDFFCNLPDAVEVDVEATVDLDFWNLTKKN